MRSPLDAEMYRPRLSGHETFPLRHGWLKKAYDAVREEQAHGRAIFSADDAIAWFGVGKNMVSSIRHWAIAAGVVEEIDGSRFLQPTQLGTLLFDERQGLDPWMEAPATSWLAHWHVSGQPAQTTWFWAFSHFSGITFKREMIVRGVSNLAEQHGWTRASLATIKRDVACLIRAYAPPLSSKQSLYEDALESPLSELGLVRPVGQRDGFRFVRGPKPTLPAGTFGYALTDFWDRHSPAAQSISLEALAHDPGSPGRVFVLGEDDLVDLLVRLEDRSQGVYRWSETAGLRQLIRQKPMVRDEALRLVRSDYDGTVP